MAPSIRNVPNGLGRLTATYQDTPLRTIRMDLSRLTGRTFIASTAADAVRITARIEDQQWDLAFRTMLLAHKLDGGENEQGIVLIQTADEIAAQEAGLPLITRILVLKRPAAGLADLVRKRLTADGRLDVDSLTNSMIITDRAAAVETILAVLKELDRLAPTSSKPSRRR